MFSNVEGASIEEWIITQAARAVKYRRINEAHADHKERSERNKNPEAGPLTEL